MASERIRNVSSIPQMIAVFRRKAHLNQKELAERIGTTQSNVARMERASYMGYRIATLRKIAQVTGGSFFIGPDKLEGPLNEIVRRIVDKFDPDQIILFGSHARGTAGPDSDVDLLISLEIPESSSTREKRLDIRAALHDIAIPKDIVVVTPAQMARQRNLSGTIIYPAVREGKVLYARQH